MSLWKNTLFAVVQHFIRRKKVQPLNEGILWSRRARKHGNNSEEKITKKSFSHLSTTHAHQELLPQRKSGNKMENIMWHHYAVVAINFLWATFIWLPEQRAAAILLRPMGVLVFYREQTPGHKTVVWGTRGAGKIPALPARMAKAGTRPDGAPAGRGEGYSLRIMLNWLRRNEMKI